MIFTGKNKFHFVECSEHYLLVARVSGAQIPFEIEEIREIAWDADEKIQAAVGELIAKKTSKNFLHAACGVYPEKRIIRRTALDSKRVKEEGYLNEIAVQQFRIEPEQYTLAILNADNGLVYDFQQAGQKEVVFCGLYNEDINKLQDKLIALNIYPERLEVGSAATIGALINYLQFSAIKTPTLMLELGVDSTHSYILSTTGLETTRPIPQGLDSMLPIVQKELGLRDENSARKLFYSDTFDFTGMGGSLTRKLVKELQSSIGFYEVQTGQSIGQICCTQLPAKLSWLENAIAAQLGVPSLKINFQDWLAAAKISLSNSVTLQTLSARRFGILGLMAQFTPYVTVSEKAE